MDSPPPQQLAGDVRTLRVLAIAVAMGVVVFTAVFAYLVSARVVAPSLTPDLAFYLSAGASVLSILAGFALQRRLADQTLPALSAYAPAIHAIRTTTITSFAAMEAGALFGGVMGLLSGTLAPLAFVVPFFAFAWLFFPSDTRVAYWLASVGNS